MSVRLLIFVLFLACAGWMGWKSYTYLFDTDVPLIMMVGLENDTYYCGEVQCCVASDKKCKLSLRLDGQLLTSSEEICRSDQEYPIIIPTRTLSNGKHVFKIAAADTSYHRNKSCLLYTSPSPRD